MKALWPESMARLGGGTAWQMGAVDVLWLLAGVATYVSEEWSPVTAEQNCFGDNEGRCAALRGKQGLLLAASACLWDVQQCMLLAASACLCAMQQQRAAHRLVLPSLL